MPVPPSLSFARARYVFCEAAGRNSPPKIRPPRPTRCRRYRIISVVVRNSSPSSATALHKALSRSAAGNYQARLRRDFCLFTTLADKRGTCKEKDQLLVYVYTRRKRSFFEFQSFNRVLFRSLLLFNREIKITLRYYCSEVVVHLDCYMDLFYTSKFHSNSSVIQNIKFWLSSRLLLRLISRRLGRKIKILFVNIPNKLIKEDKAGK